MLKSLLLVWLWSQTSFARPWIIERCSAFLGGHMAPAVSAAEFHTIEGQLGFEIFRNRQYNRHPFKAHVAKLEFLADKPQGIEIVPQLGAGYSWVHKVTAQPFVNPAMMGLDFSENAKSLGLTPALLVVYDDVTVKNGDKGLVRLEDLFAQSFRETQSHNADMKAKMHFSDGSDVPGIRLAPGKKVFWVQGDLSNHLIERILLLEAEKVFAKIAEDSRYVSRQESADEKAPLK